MYQAAILVKHSFIATVNVVSLELLDVLAFVIQAGADHDGLHPSVLPSALGELVGLVDCRHLLDVEIDPGGVVGMYFPGLVVGPGVVMGLVGLEGCVGGDEDVDIALGSVLHPSNVCDSLGGQWLLGF